MIVGHRTHVGVALVALATVSACTGDALLAGEVGVYLAPQREAGPDSALGAGPPPPPTDSGERDPNTLRGCLTPPKGTPISCDDGGGMAASEAITFHVEPGKTYQYSYSQLLPIGIGEASTADVYLGMTPCDRAEKVSPSSSTQRGCRRTASPSRKRTGIRPPSSR